MKLTGSNLLMVRRGLQALREEVHNQIVTCSDPLWYHKEIASLERRKARITQLLTKVNTAVAKERARA